MKPDSSTVSITPEEALVSLYEQADAVRSAIFAIVTMLLKIDVVSSSEVRAVADVIASEDTEHSSEGQLRERRYIAEILRGLGDDWLSADGSGRPRLEVITGGKDGVP